MYPSRPAKPKDVVQKKHEICRLEIEKVFPRRDLQVRVVEEAYRRYELSGLDRDSAADGKPTKDVGCRAPVTL